MTSDLFFSTHPVFTRQEFVTARGDNRRRSPRTADGLLRAHVARGRLLRVRGGLYSAVPRGIDPERLRIDPYLVATKLTTDAVVGYHAALEFWGRAYSIWRRVHYFTQSRRQTLAFRDLEFVPVQAPRALRGEHYFSGVTEQRHGGGIVRVTTLERTLVDVLDMPTYAGGWEEIWRSLQMIEFIDLDAAVHHALERGSALTIARVGFFLEQHRDLWTVSAQHLARLRRHRPRQPRYLDARRQPGKLVPAWNLVVPPDVLNTTWTEVA